ncbi:hypothetical protein [Kribbella sp. NPDC006257]|uniref:hypothetical protein n=1 Tax=Kribbella sp. NPDC006257 TaxID=3156738 RepID=UPI0033AD16C3
MTTYQVHVTREGDQWLADVPGLEGTQTYAASLTALERYVREIIVLGADLPDDAVGELDLSWSYDVSDPLVVRANELRGQRADLVLREKVLERETRELAIELTRTYSVRDTGPLLGISHQRVSQLTPEDHRKHRTKKSIGRRPAPMRVVQAESTPKRRAGRQITSATAEPDGEG